MHFDTRLIIVFALLFATAGNGSTPQPPKPAAPAATQPAAPVVLRASRVLDGTGKTMDNVDITVSGGRITGIRASSGALPANGIDLRRRTVLPGLIDVHVHLGWYINDKGKLHQERDGDTPATGALAHAGNAWATLQAGFTTVQSIGERENAALRDAINRGLIPGPRVLTSLGSWPARTHVSRLVERADRRWLAGLAARGGSPLQVARRRRDQDLRVEVHSRWW
jgi:imidazolonepropionase-like amidohydrolase